VTDEQVINDATIQDSATTSRSPAAAVRRASLHCWLRSGSAVDGIYPIEERAVGPSLVKDTSTRVCMPWSSAWPACFSSMAI